MVNYFDKNVEELRKMASKKNIKGRSKMNKITLIKNLILSSSSKKMKGGVLTNKQLVELLSRNFDKYPMLLFGEGINNEEIKEISDLSTASEPGMLQIKTKTKSHSVSITQLTIFDDGKKLRIGKPKKINNNTNFLTQLLLISLISR